MVTSRRLRASGWHILLVARRQRHRSRTACRREACLGTSRRINSIISADERIIDRRCIDRHRGNRGRGIVAVWRPGNNSACLRPAAVAYGAW